MSSEIEKVYKCYNILIGRMNQEDVVVGLFLVAETCAQVKKCSYYINAWDAYDIMRKIADTLMLKNPYKGPSEFEDVFQIMMSQEQIDWEIIIATLDDKSMDIMHIPYALIKQFEEHFLPETETVLIAEGEKFAPYIKSLVDKYSYCKYVITSQSRIYKVILEKIFEEYKNVIIKETSIYEYGFLIDRFDLILSVPVFGGRNLVNLKQGFICREYDLVAVENLLLHLNEEGKLVIVVPARITFAVGDVVALRNFIHEMYKLVELAELPAGIFHGTGIQTNMLVIGGGRTDDMDDISVRKYRAEEKKNTSNLMDRLILEDETFVIADELLEQGDWNLKKIFASQDEDWLRFMGVNRVALKDVAEVFRGKAVNRKDENGNYGVINISNLGEYVIDYESIDYLEEKERKVANYILKTGDVLLPARGTAIRTCIFEEQTFPCIASSNVIVIRPDLKELSGTYLKVFLDSPLGRKILASSQQGTSIINISYKDLMNLEIPLPNIDKQLQVEKEYKEELKIYQEVVKSAEDRWNAVRSRLQNELQ